MLFGNNSDDEDDKESATEESSVLLSRRSSHSNESEPMDTSLSSRPRSSRLKKASAIVVPSSALNSIGRDTEAHIVRIRLVFIHIGEIDTLKEQFQAEAFIQARWSEPTLKGTVSDM